MQILAVRTARLIAYLNAEELNPEGRPLAHDYLNAFVERYSFIKRPTTPTEILDPEDKGITFELGKFANFAINKVVLFDTAVAIETAASTDASEEILQDMLSWGAATFGLSNRPDLITRRAYVSEIVFSSALSLRAINPDIQTLANMITRLVGGYMGNSLPFETIGINMAFDSTQSKQIYTPFSLHRLADTPFTENKYYSAAPLQTSDHIAVLNDFETFLE